jgi:hypothetical protein
MPTRRTGSPIAAAILFFLTLWLGLPAAAVAVDAIPAPGTKLPPPAEDRVIAAADVTVERVGTSIPASAIGEPVGGVTRSPARWIEATENSVAHALVDGAIAPNVIPQAGHGLSGRSSGMKGGGQGVSLFPIPNRFDRTSLIRAWVERYEARGKMLVVTAGGRSLPLCSYPDYPRYKSGPPESAASHESAAP